MATETGRLLGRSIRDVTRVTADELRSEICIPHVVPKPLEFESVDPAKAQVICIASGKGGTGKTVVTTNLAISLAREGFSVLIFDADMGLANAHLLLDVSPAHDISSVMDGSVSLSDIIVECDEGVRLISGGSGFSELAELKDSQLRYLADQFRLCEAGADIILVDLSAGISPQVMRFLGAAHDVILVTTPDVTAMMDAYATIKSFAKDGSAASIKLIINRARDRLDALDAFRKIRSVAAKHLGNTAISFFGWIPQNWYIQSSICKRQPVVVLHPRSFVTACFKAIAARVKANYNEWQKDKKETATTFSSKLANMVFE